MGNFSWTNFKPFVIIYLMCCILGYFLSPGIQSNINYKVVKRQPDKGWMIKDLDMINAMYFDEELIELARQIEIDSARNYTHD